MQDHHFDELREALGAQQGEGFEEKLAHMLNNKVGDDLDDEEAMLKLKSTLKMFKDIDTKVKNAE